MGDFTAVYGVWLAVGAAVVAGAAYIAVMTYLATHRRSAQKTQLPKAA
ncbi:MAG TPA: hypothetical protein VET65_10965 [Candidatus Limnocylindrales bacterium]|nr:hypothetical protein [Candidatus Limnocylindrales bacterium]